MVFSSIPFLYFFLPAVLVLYFAVPRRFKNLVLFLTSLLFYAWGEPVYIIIMLVSTVFDYINGLLLERFDKRPRARKAVLVMAVVGNLAILTFFKYSDFFISNLNAIANLDIGMLGIALPIGISFYTFQTMSYSIDVYRREAPVQHNIISFGAYVTLFPQLIAGPIVRYSTIAEQLDNRKETFEMFFDGLVRFCAGLAKKVLLANNIGALWNEVSAMQPEGLSVLMAWLGIIAFALQIYFDFSGYSDMAIGLGKMFGFTFLENFNYPYISKSITEFWRRWHISLGTWFREYVYIPLGGNRKGAVMTYINIFVVWFLTGFWARRKLELCRVGAVLCRDPDSGKGVSAQGAGQSAGVCVASLCDCIDSGRVGHLFVRFALGRHCLFQDHVWHGDGRRRRRSVPV